MSSTPSRAHIAASCLIGLGLLAQVVLLTMFYIGYARELNLVFFGSAGIAGAAVTALGALLHGNRSIKWTLTFTAIISAVGWWRMLDLQPHPGDGSMLDPTILIAPVGLGASLLVILLFLFPRPQRPYAWVFLIFELLLLALTSDPITDVSSDLFEVAMTLGPVVTTAQLVTAARSFKGCHPLAAKVSAIGAAILVVFSLVPWAFAAPLWVGLAVTAIAAGLELFYKPSASHEQTQAPSAPATA